MTDSPAEIAGEYEALVQFMYLAPVGLVQATLEGEIVMINPISAQLLMPLARDGSLVNLFTALENVAPDLRNMTASFVPFHGMVCDALRIQLDAGMPGSSDPRMLSLSILKLDETRLMAVLSDVTMQARRERLLRQNEAWLNAVLTDISDYALISLDAHGCVDDWNVSIGRVTGFTREAAFGQPYSIFYPSDATTPDRILDRLREADMNGWSLDDGWRVKADGTQFWGSGMIAPLGQRQDLLSDASGSDPSLGLPGYCLVIRDITDKREASEAQRRAFSCDYLTGIANRQAFFEAAALELERGKRSPRAISLILFDVDHFKQINDTYGHPAGDAVLRQIADRLTTTFRQVDIVARLGGEEFAVLLPSANLQSAAAAANRLRQAIESQAMIASSIEINCTLSGGVATMGNCSEGLDALIKHADLALYAAKAAGRNRIECWSSSPLKSVSGDEI